MNILNAIWIARIPALAFVIVGLFWGSLAASIPDIKDRLGVNDAVFGLLLLGNAVGLVTAMFLAPRADKLLGARGLQIVAMIFACWMVMPGVVGSAWAFFFVILGMGVASGLTDVLMNARLSELENLHKRTLMNAGHGMFSVGYAVSAFGTGLFRDVGFGPEVPMGLAAFLSLLLATQLKMAPEIVEDDPTETSGMPWGILLICGGIVLVAFMTEATVETWSALHIERTLNGDALAGALGPTMLGITMAVGRLGGQGISDRFDDQKVIVVASILASAGAFVAAVAQTPFVAYVGFGVLGLGVSVIGPLGLALLGKNVRPKHRTEAISKAAVMGFCGFFIAPVLMGNLSEVGGLRVAYMCVAVFALSSIPLLVFLRRKTAQA